MLACRLANGELFRMVGREADTRLDIAGSGDGSLLSKTPGSSAHTCYGPCELRSQTPGCDRQRNCYSSRFSRVYRPPLPLDVRLRRAWTSRLPLTMSRVVAQDGHQELKLQGHHYKGQQPCSSG
jgi:hypothetical protein